MNAVAVIRNQEELEILSKHLEKDPHDLQLYTAYAHNYFDLVEDYPTCRLLSSFLSAEECYEIYSHAFEDTVRIVDSFPITEMPFPLNTARLFKFHIVEFLSEFYAIAAMLERLTHSLGDNKLYFVETGNYAPSHYDELTDAQGLLEHALEVLGARCPQRIISIKAPLATRNRTMKLEGFRKRVHCFTELPEENLTCSKDAGYLTTKTERRVIGLGNGYDVLIVIPDVIRLSNELGLAPLLMTDGIDKNPLQKGLMWKPEYEGIETLVLNTRLSSRVLSKLESDEESCMNQMFDEFLNRLGNIAEFKMYDLCPCLEGLRNEYLRALQLAKGIDKLLEDFSGSLLVVTHFNGLVERIIEQLAKRHNIVLHGRPHGWLNRPELYEYVADNYYCEGSLRAYFMDKVYGYKERLCLSPDPNLQNISNRWARKSSSEQQTLVRKGRNKLGIKSPLVALILTTAPRYLRILNEFDEKHFFSTWKTLFPYIKSSPDIHFLIKSHKRNFDAWIHRRAYEHGISNLTILEGRLEDALVLSDLVIELGKPGGGCCTSFFLQRPYLMYRGLYKYVREFGDLVFERCSDFSADTPDELVESLEQFRKNPEGYIKTLLSHNQKLLRELVHIEA